MNEEPMKRTEEELDRDLTRILGHDPAGDMIVPSSGFSARVMENLHESAEAPPPLAFPWKRALPAFGCALAILLYAGLRFISGLRYTPVSEHAAAGLQLPPVILNAAAPLGWIALALLVALVSVKLCLRLAAPRT